MNNGLLLSSLILDYMIIRVKEKEYGEGKIKRTERGRNEREKGEAKRKTKALGSSLFDHDSSVEVGYGLFLIR